ncbi:MAG: glycine cleavage system aminomethyltransferase GcvT [Candidatus Eisenbacteria bacterium]|nr:glycine cleavage system aminomethyltransferase GcvT [Candidatus Eisenbacteria bacterium]
MRRTPLYETHKRNGGKMVPFAGWEMPVQFPTGIVQEHLTVRRAAGLFDVSHMGRIEFRGSGALDYVNYLITNDLRKIGPGQLLYSALCNEEGGIIDDVTVYHLGDAALLVANAANAETVLSWARSHKPEAVTIEDRTAELAQLALQGPRAEAMLGSPFAEAVRDVGYYEYTWVSWKDARILTSRNGYTGEDGFEIYVPSELAVPLADRLMQWGERIGVAPAGLGARDSLRMEVNYALYGNELSQTITPLEAGLRWVVKLKKEDFIGKSALVRQKSEGVPRKLIGFAVEGKRLPRHGHPIRIGGQEVGVVTSGGYCPSLERGMGMGYVPPDQTAVGTELEIDARGTRLPARIVERPFYKDGSVKR